MTEDLTTTFEELADELTEAVEDDTPTLIRCLEETNGGWERSEGSSQEEVRQAIEAVEGESN